jgi:hypothetical protein
MCAIGEEPKLDLLDTTIIALDYCVQGLLCLLNIV